MPDNQEATFEFRMGNKDYSVTGEVVEIRTGSVWAKEVNLKITGSISFRIVHSDPHFNAPVDRHAGRRCKCECSDCLNPETKKCKCEECSCVK